MTRQAIADRIFLEHVQPRALTHAAIHFRRHPERDDLTQEVLCYCLKWTRLLLRRGKDPRKFPTALARYAVLAVRNGRRLCGQLGARDVFSAYAQAQAGFSVSGIPDYATMRGSSYEDALADNTVTPPGDQAAFRIDFPRWLLTLSERNRRLVEQMMLRERTHVLSRKFGMSPARISQLRREFHREWMLFHGDLA